MAARRTGATLGGRGGREGAGGAVLGAVVKGVAPVVVEVEGFLPRAQPEGPREEGHAPRRVTRRGGAVMKPEDVMRHGPTFRIGQRVRMRHVRRFPASRKLQIRHSRGDIDPQRLAGSGAGQRNLDARHLVVQ